ncbi:hydroxymethylglutaryl-CoA lyase [Candidimonas nitroreducens]|uniref:Hydroxymethylglutaryl-CoA lyase n=1 Tax=Candidimonas nitroreducens TaxID=683354 RepID=A0A225N0U0_9BURK|nr:hydroxymethylglutaryl-CoA lyase [Candidimonas nitroreducens]OWT66423.1 hydroxymethylglutaryl-CoA lyase [Candidimonas nitroreducens]
MSDLPKSVTINEEGPREGFQIEPGPIETARKIELIDALAQTGLRQIQTVSFVPPKNVPGMADADAVVAGIRRRPGVAYTALWLNERGLLRALASPNLDVFGTISLCPSAAFLQRNQKRTLGENYEAQRSILQTYKKSGVKVRRGGLMATFGCNFEGDIPVDHVVGMVGQLLQLASEAEVTLDFVSLADTMAWATPTSIQRVVGSVRERFPGLRLSLHLHDTRGMGIANAFAGLQMGVDIFDAAVAGLGGCPFAGHRGAAGNVCTEDLVFLCEEMGISTGIDLDSLVETARLAEDIVGHMLPGSVKTGGTLSKFRNAQRVAV